jgi:CspA family cold shock protein
MKKKEKIKMVGKVKWFNNEKGYGFIKTEEGKDVFVHYSNVIKEGFKTLEENENVEFDVQQVDKGLQAINVKSIEELNE